MEIKNVENMLAEKRRIVSAKLFEKTPEIIRLKIQEKKWNNFVNHFEINSVEDLLNFDINELTNAVAKQLFKCERSCPIRVLCSPPYSLIDKQHMNKKNLLQRSLTDEQKELARELFSNTPDDIEKELTDIKWNNFINYYGVKTKDDLLNLNLNRVTQTEVILSCKRDHLLKVLCSPPYLLNKSFKYCDSLSSDQKDMVAQLKTQLIAEKFNKNMTKTHVVGFTIFLSKCSEINKETIQDTEKVQRLFYDNDFGTKNYAVKEAINKYYDSIDHYDKLVSKESYLIKNKKNEKYRTLPRMLKYANDTDKEWILNMIDKLKIYCGDKNLKERTYVKYFDTIARVIECLKKDNLIKNGTDIKDVTLEQFKNALKRNYTYDLKKIRASVLAHINSMIAMNIFPKFDNETVIKLDDIVDSEKIIDDDETKDDRKIGDYFTDEQLQKILFEANKDSRENLMIIIFCHTGMRVGGLRNIRMENIFDYETNELFDNGWTFDKNKKKYFGIADDANLAGAFNRYFTEYPDVIKYKGYLFPFRNKLFENQRSVSSINDIIKSICKRCNIDQSNVHSHMFRKTVVNNLMKSGNTMEKIAEFVGHNDPATTSEFYWVPTVDDLIDQMIIPWLRSGKNIENRVTTSTQKI